MSGFADWLRAFRRMHELARQGGLRGAELEAYRAGREDLARALVAAQRLTLRSGETPRRALRVAVALQADLDLLTSRERAVTLDLSTGGFACLLAKAPPLGDEIRYALRIPGADPIAGHARVQDVKALPGNVRVSFRFVGVNEAEAERLELLVFDTVLAQLSS